MKYNYEGEGNEFAYYTATIDYVSENRVQQRTNNGGTETIKVFECMNVKISVTYSKSEIFYREDFLNKNTKNTEILLMEPLISGTTWTLDDSSIRTSQRT